MSLVSRGSVTVLCISLVVLPLAPTSAAGVRQSQTQLKGAARPSNWLAERFRRQHPYLDRAIVVGERLIFAVCYGPIRAGTATMSVEGVEVVGGDSCFHVVSVAESNDFFSAFFRVEDRVESYFDTQLLLPRRFEKHLREGSFRRNESVVFDHETGVAVYDDGRVMEILPGARDVLSAFYEVRARELEVGDEIALEGHVDGGNYPLKVMVHRRETVNVPAGRFECLVVEPALRTPGLFKHEGRLLIWLTDDERRIPVQMKSKLPIGSISVVLERVEGRDDWVPQERG